MSDPLDCILLIDDNEADNFIHRMIVEESGCARRVESFQTATRALDYLREIKATKGHAPELIFLDINMPVMNGWEFLEAYRDLEPESWGSSVVVMLTTSLNREDQVRAEREPYAFAFLNKPLTSETLANVVESHFRRTQA